MKFLISTIIIAILSFVVGLHTPWWSIAIVAFVVLLLQPQKPFYAFLSGFLGIFLMWAIAAAFINVANGSILANRVGELLGIGAYPILLITIGSLVGGFVGGFAALSASYLRPQR